MTFGRFMGVLVAALLGAVLLVWVFVSLAALGYALTEGDGAAARTYAIFTAVGLAICLLAGWVARRVARARSERQ